MLSEKLEKMFIRTYEIMKELVNMLKENVGKTRYCLMALFFISMISLCSLAYAGSPYWCCDKCGAFNDDICTMCSECGSQMERYKVYLNIDFKRNLLFSRYGVNIIIDDIPLVFVDHGVSRLIKFRLKEGMHTIKLVKFDDETKFVSEDIYVFQSEMYIYTKIETNRFGIDIKKWEVKNISDPYELKYDWKVMGSHKGHHYFDLDTKTFKTTYTKGTTEQGIIIGDFNENEHIQLIEEEKTRTEITNYVLKGDWLYLCDSAGEPFDTKPDKEYDCERDINYSVLNSLLN